ncbi:GSCFA family protein [Reichenbachiella faecimaris]|uniref:GSCFA family protein n=1 Tax=Reichenbachiella faecimaris TaxID=692418 RepID=A0A1W2G6E7_REIFA|nr:GSCFA domain-containing protein [Reichenbachiella faecimaris]SMD32012.1 GSCFA family protein [Reichenbachiella faecimaris]
MIIHNANNFRTELHPKPSQPQIGFDSKLLTIGSCFSENIGLRLQENKFPSLVNPLGTVYNPISIFKLLGQESLDEHKFIEIGRQWFHLDFHSQFTGRDKKTLETVLKLKIKELSTYLSEAKVVFVTLGTAYVYEWKESGEVVANCHKIPQKNFIKRLLTLEEMKVGFSKLKTKLNEINPSIHFVFTVSPVRHIKDGIAENQLSKSLLRVLCHEWSQEEDQVDYFPAYEMMMDDLRDYRFYKTDMIHPSEMAEDYIWNKFQLTYFSDQIRKILKEWSKIKAALAHRPFNPESESHQEFLKNQLSKLEIFSAYFSTEVEKNILQQQIV